MRNRVEAGSSRSMHQTSFAGLLGLGLQGGDLAGRPVPALPGWPGAALSSSRWGLGRNRVTWPVLRLDTVALARADDLPVYISASRRGPVAVSAACM